MTEILNINGTEKQFDKLPSTLSKLLDEMEINQATVVAEMNGKIIERKDFSTIKLSAGEKIELIRFVGGG